jgi:hypothetical protein
MSFLSQHKSSITSSGFMNEFMISILIFTFIISDLSSFKTPLEMEFADFIK